MKRTLCFLAAVWLLASCAPGPRIVLDPESREFYDTARLIMTSEERTIFNHLPDAEARREFIRDFWIRRDSDPETEENLFKEEFERRIEFANRRFREGGPGWNTDRGRIYLFMGEPDKVDEFFSHGDPGVRGSIIWWIYYDYELGIEFVDERGFGQYRIRQYSGNFFEALESFKLGQSIRPDGIFRRQIARFDLTYDEDKEELSVTIPTAALTFHEEDGLLAVDLVFDVSLYEREGTSRDSFEAARSFRGTEEEILETNEIAFVFPRRLPPGTHYIDVIIRGSARGTGQARKIFTVRVR